MAEDNASPEVAPGWFASASTGEAVPPLATSGYAPPEQDHRAWIEDKAYQIIDEARTALGDYTAKDIRTAARNLTRWLYGEIEDTHGVPMPSASLTDVAKMRKAMTEAQAQADKARTEASAAEAELTLVKAEATRLKAHLDDEMASRDAEVAKHNAHLDSITEAFHRWANTHHAGDTFDEALASVGLPKRMHVYAVPVDVVVSATVQVEATTAREAREQVVKMTQPQRLQHISEKDQALTHKAMSIQPNSNPAWQV